MDVMKLFTKLLVVFLCCIPKLYADALVVNQSMHASSTIEFYIDDTGVTAELEIGMDALPVFKNLLPDSIYQDLGYGNEPIEARHDIFFSQELALLPANKKPLTGKILAIGPSKKILRDIINGSPLPIQDDAPDIVRATLRYEFAPQSRPEQLKFITPRNREIGFVVYHNEVAVNDFRYLGHGYTLELDWQDPWYSRFQSRVLARQYKAPMSGFIYVEALEVRKEIIVRPKDLQRWVDLGLEGKDIIPVEMQASIKTKVAEFLSKHQPVTINGKAVDGILDRVNFLERTLTSSRVIAPAQPLNANAAILGIIFVYPQPALPQEVTMTWDLWDERITRVPVSAVDQAGPLPSIVQPEWPELKWENFIKNPKLSTLQVVEKPAEAWKAQLATITPFAIGFTLLILVWFVYTLMKQKSARLTGGVLAVMTALSCTSAYFSETNIATPERAKLITSQLLNNIYHAFDYRDESAIYDALEGAVVGELLTDIYLETKSSLVLANQGGAQAKVNDVILESLTLEPNTQPNSFTATVNWTVQGSVGHWGHVHKRTNRYVAKLTVVITDEQQWKLEKLQVLQEERL